MLLLLPLRPPTAKLPPLGEASVGEASAEVMMIGGPAGTASAEVMMIGGPAGTASAEVMMIGGPAGTASDVAKRHRLIDTWSAGVGV
jgi:hypothetical protein